MSKCGKEVSEKAPQCPNCGAPILKIEKDVLIHFNSEGRGIVHHDCFIHLNSDKSILAKGKQGQTLSFKCMEPTEIYLVVKTNSPSKPFMVQPGEGYNITYSFMGKLLIDKVDSISGGTDSNRLF